MVKSILVFCCCFSWAMGYHVHSDGMIGPGRWIVEHIKKCPDDGRFLFQFDIRRHKMNRTHDGFSGEMTMDRPLDETYAVRTDVCKHVDGGCKPYAGSADDSFCHFIEVYAKNNAEQIFLNSGLPLPVCPIPSGHHKLADYIFDYDELPNNFMFGLYDASTFVLDSEGTEVACVQVTARFDNKED